MISENLQHTAYRDPFTKNVRLGNATLPESGQDMDQYHRPLERIHNSSLHG